MIVMGAVWEGESRRAERGEGHGELLLQFGMKVRETSGRDVGLQGGVEGASAAVGA